MDPPIDIDKRPPRWPPSTAAGNDNNDNAGWKKRLKSYRAHIIYIWSKIGFFFQFWPKMKIMVNNNNLGHK